MNNNNDIELSRRKCLQTSLAAGTSLTAGCIFWGSSSDNGAGPTTTDRSEPAGTPPRRTITDRRDQTRLQWSVSVGEGIQPKATLERNGTALLIGTSGGNVVSLNTDDGSEQWKISTEVKEKITRGPIISDDQFGVGTTKGYVSLYDQSTQQQRWNTQIDGGGMIDSLGVSNSTLYAGWHRESDEGAVEAATFAFDSADGDERWKTNISGGVADICTTGDDGVYIGGNTVAQLAPGDGSVTWTVEYETGGFTQGISCAGSTIYASSTESIAAISQSGTHQWETPLQGGSSHRPAVSSDHVFTTASEQIVAVGRDSGDVRWRKTLEDRFPGLTAPIRVAGETVYVGMSDGVWALTRSDGSVRWWYETDGSDIIGLSVHQSSIFAADADGTIYRLKQ